MTSLLSGFRDDYPYPHAHTLYFLEGADARCKLRPEQFRAKMLMFTFGNALSRAHKLYGVRIYTSHLTWCHRTQLISEHTVHPFSLFLLCYVCVSDPAPASVRSPYYSTGSGDQWENLPVSGFPAQHHRSYRRWRHQEPGKSFLLLAVCAALWESPNCQILLCVTVKGHLLQNCKICT